LRGIQREGLASRQIDGIERVKTVLQLDAISADVLHRRGADHAGNQRQVFQAGVAVLQRPGDQIVPVFTGTGLDNPGLGRFTDQAPAHDFDLEHQRLDIAGQHNVAAATQHKFGRSLQGRVLQHGVNIGFALDMHEMKRLGDDAEGVGRLEGNVFLD